MDKSFSFQAGHSQKGVVFESQEGETLPPWADPEALERAQKLFLDNAALFIMALSKALTSGKIFRNQIEREIENCEFLKNERK